MSRHQIQPGTWWGFWEILSTPHLNECGQWVVLAQDAPYTKPREVHIANITRGGIPKSRERHDAEQLGDTEFALKAWAKAGVKITPVIRSMAENGNFGYYVKEGRLKRIRRPRIRVAGVDMNYPQFMEHMKSRGVNISLSTIRLWKARHDEVCFHNMVRILNENPKIYNNRFARDKCTCTP